MKKIKNCKATLTGNKVVLSRDFNGAKQKSSPQRRANFKRKLFVITIPVLTGLGVPAFIGSRIIH